MEQHNYDEQSFHMGVPKLATDSDVREWKRKRVSDLEGFAAWAVGSIILCIGGSLLMPSNPHPTKPGAATPPPAAPSTPRPESETPPPDAAPLTAVIGAKVKVDVGDDSDDIQVSKQTTKSALRRALVSAERSD